jgi:hypothetical protein
MSTRPPLPRLPYVLLGAMTIVSFVGPFVLFGTVMGGPSDKWPPDRPIEWVVVIAVFGLASVLFLACVSLAWWFPRIALAKKPGSVIPSSDQSST